MAQLFTDYFLSHILSDFQASSVTGIRDITLILKSLIQELDSGKLESLKEEEIKSRFITEFFGDVLGFNYGNSKEWQLREEKKSAVDGKKADAALGYFYSEKKNDDVRVVIEIKDAETDLDAKQSREGKLTPIEQAFSYVPKMGGNCKWVVVSNINETRFYCSNDSSKCQVFFLKDLNIESKRNELLLLFHKDRLIKKEGESKTDLLLKRSKLFNGEIDKPIHIVDKLYKCIKRFESFGFVDPDFLVTLYPFNILDEHVWQYHNRNLFTINSEIYHLLNGISIKNNEVIFTDELKVELESANVIDAKNKLETSFKFLNNCLIYEITAIKNYKQIATNNKRTIGFSHRISFGFKEGVEGITKKIYLLESKECDCVSCNYRSLNFKKLLEKLKAGIGNEELNTPEYAYGNYLTASNNFKSTYKIYKSIEKETKGKEGKEVTYFLTKQNIKHLHNLIQDYQYSDNQEILRDIKTVDLDKVIYDEIEFNVDKQVKEYLVDVKEDVLIYKLQDEIEEITSKIEKLKRFYENGGIKHSGQNLCVDLSEAYINLYSYINRNFIIYDTFKRYRSLTEKVFKGLVTSYLTKEQGLTKFSDFFLTEAILHIYPRSLDEILKSIKTLPTDDECIEKLIKKLNNFTSSYVHDTFFGDCEKETLMQEYLNNFSFKEKYTDIFTNQFIILSRLKITNEQFKNSKKSLLKYLKVETELAWYELKQFCNFLLKKGYLFEESEMVEILKIAIDGDEYYSNKYTNLIEETSEAILKFYPNYKIDNQKLIQLAILKSSSDDGKLSNYKHLIPLIKVCSESSKEILLNTFEIQLDTKFNSDLYEALLETADYDYEKKNYLLLYTEHINVSKGVRAYKYGKHEFTDLVFIHYAYLIYKLNIDFNRSELKSLKNLNDFETWLINPLAFDYNKFDAKWLTDLDDAIFINKFKNIPKIKGAIDLELEKSFEPMLAEIKYKYFLK
jgi:hypothetical protein